MTPNMKDFLIVWLAGLAVIGFFLGATYLLGWWLP